MTPVSGAQRVIAGALALLVHVGFFAALMVSVSWRQPMPASVQAELWARLPTPAPEPVPTPQPVLPEPPPPPRAEPVATPKPMPKPEIALKAKEAERQRAQREAEARKAEEARRLEEERRRAEAQRQRAVEEALARQMQDEVAREARRLAELQQQAQAQAARQRLIEDYVARIQQKVRGHLRLPPSLTGNPEAVFRVDLLPDGEVIGNPVLVRSSGQPLYDQEVERAILKASPLPLPPDREAAAAFRSGLVLKVRPVEAGR